jgi:hypothetical protein
VRMWLGQRGRDTVEDGGNDLVGVGVFFGVSIYYIPDFGVIVFQ